MKKKLAFLISSVAVTLFVLSMLFVSLAHTQSKNSVFIKNSEAEDIVKISQSVSYTFGSYCENNGIPQTGNVFLSGYTTSYTDVIITSNEYCDLDVNITSKPTKNTTIRYYWTLKLENNVISEIWTGNSPLKEEHLRAYTFDEQLDMIPLFKKDRRSYAIGYYNNYENN